MTDFQDGFNIGKQLQAMAQDLATLTESVNELRQQLYELNETKQDKPQKEPLSRERV